MASFPKEQRPDRSDAASHVGAAVLAHVARSGQSEADFRWKELCLFNFIALNYIFIPNSTYFLFVPFDNFLKNLFELKACFVRVKKVRKVQLCRY